MLWEMALQCFMCRTGVERHLCDQSEILCLTSVPFSRVRPAKKSPKRCSAAPSPASRSRGASASSSAWRVRVLLKFAY